MKRRKFSIVVTIILLAGLITACAPSNQPVEIATDTPQPPLISTDTPAPEDPKPQPDEREDPTETPEELPQEPPPPAPVERPLEDIGPWIGYSSVAGLYAGNQDGTGLTMIHEYSVATPFVATVKLWPAPSGGRVAVLELIHFDNGINLKYPKLRIIKFPGGEVEFESWLIPESWLGDGLVDVTNNMQGTSGYETQDGMRVEQVFAAAGVWNEMAWSHDGTMLAFNAAIHGESADLYLYDTRDGFLLRLTDGPSQSVDPVFSPDGEHIIHGAVETLNYEASGSGYDYLNVWAARSDGGGVNKIYNRDIYGLERVLGWQSDSEFLVTSFHGMCGNFALRLADIHDGSRSTLISGYHRDSVYAEGQGKVLFYVDSFDGGDLCPPSAEPGTYLIDLESRVRVLFAEIDPDEIQRLDWKEETGLFYVSTSETLYTVDLDGRLGRFQTPDLGVYNDPPSISPSGDFWLFYSKDKNLVAFADLDGRYSEYEITSPQHPLWVYNSTGVLFLGEVDGDLAIYISAIPGPRPLVMSLDLWSSPNTSNPLVLVEP